MSGHTHNLGPISSVVLCLLEQSYQNFELCFSKVIHMKPRVGEIYKFCFNKRIKHLPLFSNSYNFSTLHRRPLIFQAINFVRSNNLSL